MFCFRLDRLRPRTRSHRLDTRYTTSGSLSAHATHKCSSGKWRYTISLPSRKTPEHLAQHVVLATIVSHQAPANFGFCPSALRKTPSRCFALALRCFSRCLKPMMLHLSRLSVAPHEGTTRCPLHAGKRPNQLRDHAFQAPTPGGTTNICLLPAGGSSMTCRQFLRYAAVDATTSLGGQSTPRGESACVAVTCVGDRV